MDDVDENHQKHYGGKDWKNETVTGAARDIEDRRKHMQEQQEEAERQQWQIKSWLELAVLSDDKT